jgi:hypothetical protein
MYAKVLSDNFWDDEKKQTVWKYDIVVSGNFKFLKLVKELNRKCDSKYAEHEEMHEDYIELYYIGLSDEQKRIILRNIKGIAKTLIDRWGTYTEWA